MSEKDSLKVGLCNKSNPSAAKASACGKAIIVGEHAVVYGSHAVAMPLKQMRMNLELIPQRDSSENHQFLLKLGGKEVSERVSGVIPEALDLLHQDRFSLVMKGVSSLPIGAGLGSSATLCIATLKSICNSTDLDLSRDELASLGNQLEARFHGNPSGLDTAVVAYEECVYFAKGDPIQGIADAHQHPWHFALIDSKIRASTMAMIRLAQPFFSAPEGDQRIERFDLAAKLVKSALPAGNYGAVAEAMNESGSLLREAGVVPDSIDSMLQACHESGVLAAKTTGAGGGGTILCLLNPENWDQQYRAIQETFSDYPVFHISI
ncbi:mevalonate kinase [Pseudobacteriovorax antillogorgiicola]|uniref:mevalonate kinase n=1 Tax=Pseudobacteriovorax antillogorgiicola TaxID=1513793 RepID=A0A1Y6BM87_9BACT|nr:mevalonate kinase [Pseudobacteriovorax antillogorgiicola]TCS55292.1 mevalonate kinase [Pseudobacteriovorax antillogorgiicola]SMF14617.1 mevalonate kinase [Pseudobacteriovorax antillogorgiicola]